MLSQSANKLIFCYVIGDMYIFNEFKILFVQNYVNKPMTKELTKIQVHVTLARYCFRHISTKFNENTQKSILGGSPRFRHVTRKKN